MEFKFRQKTGPENIQNWPVSHCYSGNITYKDKIDFAPTVTRVATPWRHAGGDPWRHAGGDPLTSRGCRPHDVTRVATPWRHAGGDPMTSRGWRPHDSWCYNFATRFKTFDKWDLHFEYNLHTMIRLQDPASGERGGRLAPGVSKCQWFFAHKEGTPRLRPPPPTPGIRA
jgi:hypothetical protein